jgi:hypothetical protein
MKLVKFQISNSKIPINPIDQNSKSQTFWTLNIGIWNLFVIWVLEFGALKLVCPPSFWRGAWNF